MTPRLRLIQQLGLATAHATRSDPEWIADVEKALFLAKAALVAVVAPEVKPDTTVERLLAGEG